MGSLRIAALLKEHGWVLNLILIAMGGYFVAGAANAVVAKSIRVVPTAEDVGRTGGTGRARKPRRPERFDAIATRNLFAAQQENIAASMAEAPVDDSSATVSGSDYDYDSLKKCTIPGQVRATLVAEDHPEWSMAVIYVNSEREAQVFNISDESSAIAADAFLVDVLNREVVVRRKDHFELCKAEEEGNAPKPAKRSKTTPTASSDDADGKIVKKSEDSYEIAGDYIDDTLSNLSKVATQARIVPSFKSGKANGFKLFSIKPGSIYSKIGLQNGDVIQRVNGYEMNSPDKALELYQKLKDTRSVSLEIQRRGRPKSFSYEINR